MKSTGLVVAAFALAVCANASVDLFFTGSGDPYGLRVPSLAFLHSAGNGTDFRDGYELTKDAGGAYLSPPLGPVPDVTLDCQSGQWAYMWARFSNEPTGLKVTRIDIGIDGALSGKGNIAWYNCDNLLDPNIWAKRWDGDPEVFYWNPTQHVAVTAFGVANRTANLGWSLYVGGDYRTFLLGAVRCHTCPGELTFAPSTQAYSGQPVVWTPIETHLLNKVVCIPEPASVMLLALAGLGVRRR